MNHFPFTGIKTSADARRMLKIKAARGLHRSLRAQGRVPGAEGAAARKRYAAQRRAEKALQANQRQSLTLQPDTH